MLDRFEVSKQYQPLWDRLKQLGVKAGDVLLFTTDPNEDPLPVTQLAQARASIERIVRGQVLLLGTQRGASLEVMTTAALTTLHRTIGNLLEARQSRAAEVLEARQSRSTEKRRD